jgi:WD40 repeat protein
MDSDWIDENQLVVCTAHSHVRVYDVRDQRRPTLTFSVADEFAKSLGPSKFQQLTKGDVAFSLRQIACNPTNRTQVAVAANTGDVFILLTTRKADQGHIRSRQKGVQGAVRCLLFHPTRPNALIATGLDRFVRSWDASKSRSLGTLYTKLRQNCVVFTDVLAPILKTHKAKVKEAKKKKQEEEEEDSYEFDEDDFSTDSEQEMWQDLKVTGGSKKRQRASETEEDDATPVKKSKHK